MFSDFGSFADLLAIGSQFTDTVSGFLIPIAGIALALAVLGLVLRFRAGSASGEGDGAVSSGRPGGRPARRD